MGRPGGGGGGSRSGGSHSHSRSGGGHRVGGGSRPRASSSSSRSYSSSRRSTTHHVYHHGGGYYRGSSELSPTSVILIVFIVGIFLLFSFCGKMVSTPSSTIQRTKLDSGLGYDSNAILADELDWFANETKTESKLKGFYEETGIQPYIYIKQYDSTLTTDNEKDKWAEEYYNNNIDREDGFLYVYFEEKNPDDVGYMCYINGYQTTSVMDSEAVEIFWANFDKYYYSNCTEDEMFINTFLDTGKTIMRVSTTMADVGLVIAIGVVVIIVIAICFNWWKQKRQAEKERAEETERILNTPLENLAQSSESDLERKYQ